MKDRKMLRDPPRVIHLPKALAHVMVDLENITIVRRATGSLYVFPLSAIALLLALIFEIFLVSIATNLIINIRYCAES